MIEKMFDIFVVFGAEIWWEIIRRFLRKSVHIDDR